MQSTSTSAIAMAPQSGGHIVTQTLDALEFGRLPEAIRTEVETWSAALAKVAPPIGQSLERIALSFDVSLITARRRYDAYKAHGWAGLVNRSKVPAPRADALPAAFLAHWKGLCEANQRKSKPAYRQLLLAWRTGHMIPGYEASTLDRATPPPGWSYPNLMRHAPTEYELKRVRIGTGAAADLLPPVYATREGLQVGQMIAFDDHEFNLKVLFPGQSRPMRPLMLGALDIASGCLFTQGLRPTLWDDESESKRKLTEVEMRWLVISILINIGYRGDTGTILLVEHGTAAIREELKRRIELVTGGKVKVITSGIVGERQAAGSFGGRGKGNFRHKAHLESLWNLVDNECADLLGQVGKDRNHSPEELHGREREALRLLGAAGALGSNVTLAAGNGVKGSALLPAAEAPVGVASRFDLLRYPFLTWPQFLVSALDRFARINNRRDHDLEGWGDRITVDPESGLPVKMSPQEVWSAGSRDLTRVPIHRIMDLAGADLGRRLTVRRMLLTVHDQTLAPDPMRWLARFDGELIRDGTEILGYLNPRDPDRLVAYDLQGRFIGVAEPWKSVSRLPEEIDTLHERMGAVAHLQKIASADQDARRAPIAAQLEEDRRWNDAVLTPGAALPSTTDAQGEIEDAAPSSRRRRQHPRQSMLSDYGVEDSPSAPQPFGSDGIDAEPDALEKYQ